MSNLWYAVGVGSFIGLTIGACFGVVIMAIMVVSGRAANEEARRHGKR